MEALISKDEIRRSVGDCGENKSPGPDGFTFEFFRKFWNIVGPDLCLAVEWFFHHASFPVGCNSSFIALIPKTLNPKSVGMASILVNGSPTKEFQFHRGLKQGDPLAPYLFIIIMESLHLSFSRVIEAGIFTGEKKDCYGLCCPKVLASKSNGGSLGVSRPKDIARSIVNGGAWFGTLLIRIDLGCLGLIWFSFNQVQNKCWKECFTLPGGVSGHIETISSSLIQIFEKMIFLKT
ncbi:hypothetical protein Tco_0591033 [Tanacetum coccineum]